MDKPLWNDEWEKPLQHLRVIDLSIMLPGPFLTRLLAQYGADVVKVEGLPHGDPLRAAPYASLFQLLNQGKRSVAMNLRHREGVELLKELVAEADVFVENFREGVLDAMGLNYADLSEVNPDLIYLSIRGFSGKHSTHAGHDLNFIAASGVGEWFLESGPNYSTNFADIIGGALVPAIKLAFHLANGSPRGMHLISNMEEGFRTLFLPRAFETLKQQAGSAAIRQPPEAHATLGGRHAHSRFYRCRDNRWISLNAIQDKHWTIFCEVVDHKEWLPRKEDPSLTPELEKLFLDAPSNYWEALSQNRDFCLFRVVPWEEHYTYSMAQTQLIKDPFTWCGFAPNSSIQAAPDLGADTYSLVHAMGHDNQQISEWLDSQVLYQKQAISEGGQTSVKI